MTSQKKRLERLRWCMRYIMCHPDASPAIYQEEWKINSDLAIEIAANIFGEAFCNLECLESGKFQELEEKIFIEILKLK